MSGKFAKISEVQPTKYDMKKHLLILTLVTTILAVGSAPSSGAEAPRLTNKVIVTPEIKKAFEGSDGIQIREITGTASKFEVGGTYRLVGTCRQETFKNAMLYIGNTAEPGATAITALDGSSLSMQCANGSTEFDVTFILLRPGILHATIYDMNRVSKRDNAYAGLYLGDVVFKR